MKGRFNLSKHMKMLPILAAILFYSLSHAQIVNVSPLADCQETPEIIPTCLLERTTATTPQELITNDLRVCACLKQKNHMFKAFVSEPTIREQVESEKKRLLENAARRTGNLSALQSISVADSQRDIEVSVLSYGGQEARKLSKEQRSSSEDSPVPEMSQNLTTINEIAEENSSWQCVTYQEYSVQREIPSDNEFFLLLKNTTSFSPDEWNANLLRSRYDAASDEEKDQIQLKLTFLSRNPIFQTIFKATASERFPASMISAKQNLLFSILQNLRPATGSNCHTIPNGCWQEAHQSGAFDRYAEEVGTFVTNDSVIDLASAQSGQDYQAELQRIMSEGEVLINSIPTDPEGYFRYLQTANSEIATSCSGRTVDPSCYTKFSQHCTNINRIDQRVRQGLKRNARDISTELTEDASIHAKMNVRQNPLFRTFNDKICHEPYENASGESLTFFQYREKHCGRVNALPECSDRKDLLGRYLLEHNSGGGVEDQNLRSGFANLVSNADFIAVSEVQVAAANNISESPAELRARFGNRFPSISPTGSLVPPVVDAIARTNTNPLNSSDSLDAESAETVNPLASAGSTASSPSISGNSNVFNNSSSDRQTRTSELPAIPKIEETYDSSIAPVVNPAVKENSIFTEVINQIQDEPSIVETDLKPLTTNTIRTQSASEKGTGLVKASKNGRAASVSKRSGSGSSSGSGQISSGSSNTVASLGTSRKTSGSGLFFKYNLDRNGKEKRPEVAIVSASTSSEVRVDIPRNQLERIRSNPNALMLDPNELEGIFANPDKEVKLILETENGEKLVLYARKDGSGGVSFGLRPSALDSGRSPASAENIVRIEANSDMYRNISEYPDVFLNQNDILIKEIKKQEGGDIILQIVSPGERARSYKVKELYENVYQFREIKNY